jgi:predicted AlkP superfamily phosphohydrolase/phosphomutase
LLTSFPSTLLYIDPTGGLPPSIWVSILSGILASLGAAWLAMRTFGRQVWASSAALVKRHYRAIIGIAILVPLSFFAAMSIFKDRKPAQNEAAQRVLVLALDGLDPGLLEQFMGEARLPNFSRLAAESGLHRLATTNPPQSPVAWSSFITASEPSRHGMFDFIKRDPRSYAPDLAIADREHLSLPWKGTPFWEGPALSRLGIIALRMPMSFPPPVVKGRILAGMGVWDIRGTEGTYTYLSTAAIDHPEARGIILRLEGEDRALQGKIPGPYHAGKPDNVREPFVIDASQRPAVLKLQGKDYALPDGRWSDWIRLEFRFGPLNLQKVRAVTRMLLKRERGEISLYISPLNFDPAAPYYPISHPGSYASDLVDAVGLYHTRGMPFDTPALTDGFLSDEDFLAHCRIIDEETEKMLFFELGRFETGMLFSYFESPDIVQHMFWRGIDREHPLYETPEAAGHRDTIARWYEQMDALVGRARAALGGRGTLVVLSDHGFAPFRTAIHLNSVLRDLGFLKLKNDSPSSAQFFASVDWPRTQAYALGFNALYLNLAGREQHGIVTPRDAPALAAKMKNLLEQWTLPQDGNKPIRQVLVDQELDPSIDKANQPELIVGYGRGYRASWETALGGVPPEFSAPNSSKWSGDHCIDPALVPGIFLSTDPALRASKLWEVGSAIERYLSSPPVRE